MRNICILDTETASLSGPVVEIAWLLVDESLKVLQERVARVNPGCPIEPGAFAVHGISDADVAECPPLSSVVVDLPQPIWMIAHNAQFDERMIHGEVVVGATLCTLALARQYIKGVSNYKLETLKKELGLSSQNSHSAKGDVTTVLELLQLILKASGRTLANLFEAQVAPRLIHSLPFGMYKGVPLLRVPRPYRMWLLAQPDLPSEIKHTLSKFKDI